MSKSEAELAPCPFCGSSEVGISTGILGDEDGHHDWIECRGCGTQQRPINEDDPDGYHKAFERWNTRALDPEVERLKAEAALQQVRADQQAEWAIREAERCVELEKVFAETAILLTHPDENRRATAKERVLAALSQTQSQAQEEGK